MKEGLDPKVITKVEKLKDMVSIKKELDKNDSGKQYPQKKVPMLLGRNLKLIMVYMNYMDLKKGHLMSLKMQYLFAIDLFGILKIMEK